MEEILGASDAIIKTKTGTINPQDAIKGVKLVFLYFSMHTCPPCREFTPLLVDLYNEFNASEK